MINEFLAIESFVNPLLYRTSVTPRSDKVPIRQFEATWLTDFRDIQRGQENSKPNSSLTTKMTSSLRDNANFLNAKFVL